MMIRFGPSGNSESFYDQGFDSSARMPAWLREMGLDAYEYQCTRGIRISSRLAGEIGQEARRNDIFVSIHAPYYINLASQEADKLQKSAQYILETLKVARLMGAGRIIVHTGSTSGIDRKIALATAVEALKVTIREADAAGLGDIAICPEVLGKNNQLGTLEEILEMCGIDERLIPVLDFAHIHARSLGGLKTVNDFLAVLESVENALGSDRLKRLHVHFSRVEFTSQGEKKHWTIDDTQYGPEFSLLAEALCSKGLEPVIICESRSHMAEDALKLKKIYDKTRASMLSAH